MAVGCASEAPPAQDSDRARLPGAEERDEVRVKETLGYQIESVEHGKASWYSIRSNGGTHTASGQKLCDQSATAAHKTLPMGTKVKVTNITNGRSEIVTINNRGPYIRGRIIDVTVGAAERLGFRQRGVVPVKIEVLKRGGQSE
ncbi:MAG: septal ring lytic transglycosylase RlpA family protein [Luteolibacter sp.]